MMVEESRGDLIKISIIIHKTGSVPLHFHSLVPKI